MTLMTIGFYPRANSMGRCQLLRQVLHHPFVHRALSQSDLSQIMFPHNPPYHLLFPLGAARILPTLQTNCL